MKNTRFFTVILSVGAILLTSAMMSSCSNGYSAVSSAQLDLTPLLQSRGDETYTDGSVWVTVSAWNTSTNSPAYSYNPPAQNINPSANYASEGADFPTCTQTVEIPDIPYGAHVTAVVSIYTDSSLSFDTFLVTGSAQFIAGKDQDVSLTLEAPEKLNGFMYSNTDTTKLATGLFDANGRFYATGNTFSNSVGTTDSETSSLVCFNTTFDSYGNRYTLYCLYESQTYSWYIDCSDGTTYRVTFTGVTFTSPSCAIAVDTTDSLLFINIYDTTDGTFSNVIYKTATYPSGSDSYAATEVLNLANTDGKIKALAFYSSTDGTTKYLYRISTATTDSSSTDYLFRYPVTVTTTENGTTTKIDTSGTGYAYGTLSFALNTSGTISPTLTDMAVVGDTVYVLGSDVTTTITTGGGFSFGALFAVPYKFSASDGAITPTATYGMASSGVPSSSEENTCFFGPARILAVTSKKIIIADDGYQYKNSTTDTDGEKTFYINKIKRTMIFDIAASNISAGAATNDYAFSNVYEASSAATGSIVSATTNGQ